MKFRNLPEEVIDHAKKLILDTLGYAIGASKTRIPSNLIDKYAGHVETADGGPHKRASWEDVKHKFNEMHRR